MLVTDQKKVIPQLQEIQISYRSKVKAKDRVQILSSQHAYATFMSIWNIDTVELYESFYVLFLDRSNRVLGFLNLSIGGITGTIVDARLLFATALQARATSIIMAHNHPSGRLLPSQPDKKLTRKMVEGGKLLDLSILDHLIIGDEGYYSFADEGEM